jgi:transcriptional regulator
VHRTVQASLIEELDVKDNFMKKLIADHEPAYARPWQGMDAAYAQKMLSGIVAFELKVTSLQCKLKLNQHRPEASTVMHSVYINGSDDEQALIQ